MSNKAKPGAEDEEKQSPTDLQEIQLQMNATTDEVMTTIIITAPFIAARRQLSPREAEASVTSVQLVIMNVKPKGRGQNILFGGCGSK